MAAAQVVVFLDYQNVYMGARRSFHVPGLDPSYYGNVNPLALGMLLASKGPPHVERELKQVRVYRGRPENSKDPQGYGANRRQCDVWEKTSDKVWVYTRMLRYPRDWPQSKPEEKGIDVALAIDFAMLAARGEYDVGILMSTDTDLKPALEAVCELGRGSTYPRCEVATWAPSGSHARRLSVDGHQVWCHFLNESDYGRVKDQRDYNVV